MNQSRCIAISLVFATSVVAAATVDDAKRDIVQTYDFDPSGMSFDEQAKRAPALGQLWGRFSKSPDAYREALRSLLTEGGNREMVYCDGGMLFLEKAIQPADKELGLKSIQKCSLSEIQHTPYFYTMHGQALNGVDTLDLQFKMLTKPKYQIFVPMHALTLGQDFSFVYPLLVQDEAKYASRLVEKTKKEKDPTALNSLLLALYYTALPETEAAIHSVAGTKGVPATVQDRAGLFERRIDEARKTDAAKVHEWLKRNEAAIPGNATEKDLRDARRKRMRAVSDEALMELDAYTLLIYQARTK